MKLRIYSKQLNKFIDNDNFYIRADGVCALQMWADRNSNLDEKYIKENFIFQRFVGINDSTGKEIYEGDIVSIFHNAEGMLQCKVMYINTGFFLVSMSNNAVFPIVFDWQDVKEVKVVGNVLN